PVRASRKRRSQDEDPVRAVPRPGRRRRALCRAGAPRRVPAPALMEAAMDHEKKPELRLAGDSFSQELVDEGHAGALDVAQTLAEKLHLPLIDLGAVGVDAEAVKMIAVPALHRVVAIPFASDGSTLKVAITDPQDVRGLDEVRIATRQ